jgi:ABC-2 type transport system ATP-binding protein
MADALLQVKEITKYYEKFCAFERLSLTVQQGEIFGLLGLNGAGKTTLFKSILRFVHISSGDILYKGKSLTPAEIQDHIGYLPELFMPIGELSASEFLRLLGYGISVSRSHCDMLFEKTELNPDKKIKDYSRGMIQRLGLAIALLKDPEFIMLDEPTLGLDPIAQQKMLNWFKELNVQGKTIFFTSHYLSHVEKLCHQIAVIHQGKIRFVGPTVEFLEKHKTGTLEDAFLKEVGFYA